MQVQKNILGGQLDPFIDSSLKNYLQLEILVKLPVSNTTALCNILGYGSPNPSGRVKTGNCIMAKEMNAVYTHCLSAFYVLLTYSGDYMVYNIIGT